MASVSPAATATIPNGPVSLSLAKISHCSTSPHQLTMTWTHIPNHDGMFAVFDTVRRRNIDGSVTEKRMLKVINRNDQLDQIDLDTLRRQARLEEYQSIHDEDMRVIVIVKKPLLALRYPLPNGQIRRVQLNFRPESGFDYAVNTLQLFDLPIRFKNDYNATGVSTGRRLRPHSVQVAASGTMQQNSQQRFQPAGGSQNYASSVIQPAPIPAFASPNLPTPYQRTLPVSGIDQDSFSKPLLAHQSHSDWEASISFPSQHVIPPPAPLPNDPRDETINTGLGRASDYSAEAPSGSWKWIPHEAERTRPTTAPAKTSERLVPETLSLSQMLPPDRVLPFSEKKESKSLSHKLRPSGSSEQLPEIDSGANRKTKSAGHGKFKKSARTRRNSPASRSSLTPNRASTPYNLKPASSSSNVGPSRPATSDSTLFSDAAKVPVRDKLAERRVKLSREGWILSEAEFLQHFSEEAFKNNAFLEELVKFAKIEKNFAAAYPILVSAQRKRRSQTPVGYKFREWMSNDVKNAMALYNQPAWDKNAEITTMIKANTPRKRTRNASSQSRNAERVSPELTQDSATDEPPHTLLPPPISSPQQSPTDHKRLAPAIDQESGNPETEAVQTEPARSPAPEQHTTAVTLSNSPLQPTTPPPLPLLHPDHPPTISTEPPTLSPNQPPPTQPADAPANTTPIPPADLLTLLNTWAQSTPLFQPPPTLPETSKDLLADFASKDDETRAQALDDLICECLEDENFAQLVQDVEGAWMRIGLGF